MTHRPTFLENFFLTLDHSVTTVQNWISITLQDRLGQAVRKQGSVCEKRWDIAWVGTMLETLGEECCYTSN